MASQIFPGERRGNNSSEDSLPRAIASVPPLAIDDDDSCLEDMPNEAEEDFEENFERPYRNHAAKTLYHHQCSDDDTMNSTRSLYEDDVIYFMIHGRRYCKDYYMPNDEEEQTRTQILHGVFQYLLDGKLTTVPLEHPQKILDIGTGTGEWAMAMGDLYPEAEVIGTDIAKIQPSAVPLNVFFEIDDAEEDGGWTWPEDEFDLIHFRSMQGAFKDWKYIYSEAYKHLKPGGWIEVLDFDDHKQLLSYFSAEPEVPRWLAAIGEASRISGMPRTSTHLEPESLTELGFVDASSTGKVIPLGVWPTDPEALKIGKLVLVTQLCGIEALCLRPLTEVLCWDPEEVKKVCTTVANNIRSVALDASRAQGLGFRVKVLTGRKPEEGNGPPTPTPEANRNTVHNA